MPNVYDLNGNPPHEIPRMKPRTVEEMAADMRSMGEPLADEMADKLEESFAPGTVLRIESHSFGEAAGRSVSATSWQGTAQKEETP